MVKSTIHYFMLSVQYNVNEIQSSKSQSILVYKNPWPGAQ